MGPTAIRVPNRSCDNLVGHVKGPPLFLWKDKSTLAPKKAGFALCRVVPLKEAIQSQKRHPYYPKPGGGKSTTCNPRKKKKRKVWKPTILQEVVKGPSPPAPAPPLPPTSGRQLLALEVLLPLERQRQGLVHGFLRHLVGRARWLLHFSKKFKKHVSNEHPAPPFGGECTL